MRASEAFVHQQFDELKYWAPLAIVLACSCHSIFYLARFELDIEMRYRKNDGGWFFLTRVKSWSDKQFSITDVSPVQAKFKDGLAEVGIKWALMV